ncbi:MAG: glycosyltransferase family 4 protein [Planctomycetes bacterium]|jgi:glycosyltransferase involved in cell wall biosynthesis|nr:glycosyltransferase family 4 protein [Planctomycetota bacterium]
MADTGRQGGPERESTRRDTTRIKARDTGKLRQRAALPWRVAAFAPALELNGVTFSVLNALGALVAAGSKVLLVAPSGALRQAATAACTQWFELPPGRMGFFTRRELKRRLADFDPEVLHAATPAHGLGAVWAADLLDRPLVLSVYGVKPHELPPVGDTRHDAYVAVDHAVREHLLNDCRIDRDRTTLLPHVVAPARPPVEREILNPRRQPVIGFVSPLFEGCAYRTFVEAAMRVMGRGVDCMFAILGDGPEGPRVRELVEERGMQQRVVQVQHMFDYGRIWEPFDAVVIDSRQVAAGAMVLQAMAHGLPVVATEGGAVFDVIEDGVDGLIVPRDNPDALAERLLMLVQNPQERLRMARACYARIEQGYDAEALAGALGTVYAALQAQEPLPRSFEFLRPTRGAKRAS